VLRWFVGGEIPWWQGEQIPFSTIMQAFYSRNIFLKIHYNLKLTMCSYHECSAVRPNCEKKTKKMSVLNNFICNKHIHYFTKQYSQW